MAPARQGVVAGRWREVWAITLAAGALLQLWFWWRAVWLYRDQIELYALGMNLVRSGELVPFGKLATGDYTIPGVLLQLLIGLPLLAWRDYRASTLLMVVFHLGAALLLSRVLQKDFGWRVAAIFLAVFWLSPWRLYHAGFLWEANYLLLPAAAHLWSCHALRQRPRPWPTAALTGTVVATLQIHGSVVILVLGTLLLAVRRRIRLHLGGAVIGCAAAGISLLPTLRALLGGTAAMAEPTASADMLTRLNSVEKGFLYWFRLSSLDIGRRFRQSVFCKAPGGGDTIPEPGLCNLVHLTEVLALASIAVSLAAGWWLLRRRRVRSTEGVPTGPSSWHRDYVLAMFFGVLVAGLLSPVLLQGWHVLIALPAACLPVALWIDHRWPQAGAWLRGVVLLFVLWRIPASLLLLGHPMYAAPASPRLPAHLVPADLQELLPD